MSGRGCERDSFLAEVPSVHDDPFAREGAQEPVLASSREFTLVTEAGPAPRTHGLARLDPDASADDANERTGPNWVPLEWARRTLRTRAFVTGVASGALAGVFVMLALAVAARPSGTVITMPAQSGPEAAVAAKVTSPPHDLPRAARTRRAPSSQTATAVATAPVPRAQSAEPVNPEPASSTTNAAETQGAAHRSSDPRAVESVDSTPASASADAGEPVTEDAEAVAEVTGAAAGSDDAAEEEGGAHAAGAAKPEEIAHPTSRDTSGTVEVAADDGTGAEAPPSDASTASATVPAQETIATANASR